MESRVTEPFYDANLEAHELGSVLVAAVFEAFANIYQRKTARYLRLATEAPVCYRTASCRMTCTNILS